MLQIHGFKEEGTGGNCTALVAITEKFEYLLTDDNMGAPEEFPVILSIYNGFGECVYGARIKDAETLEKIRDVKEETVEAFSEIVPSEI